jgi:hypothetical protein
MGTYPLFNHRICFVFKLKDPNMLIRPGKNSLIRVEPVRGGGDNEQYDKIVKKHVYIYIVYERHTLIGIRKRNSRILFYSKLSLCLNNQAPRHEDIWMSGGIAPPFLPRHEMEVTGQLYAPAPLPTGREDLVSIGFEVGGGGHQNLAGRCKNVLSLLGLDPGHPARSLSLCRLRYPGILFYNTD